MLYVLIILFSAIAQYFGPWWLMPIVCFVLCLWKADAALKAFGVAFFAAATLWLGYASYQHFANEGLIGQKVADIFKIPNVLVLVVITTLIGGIVSGFAGMAGYYCRRALA
ncbi:hypothetical protein DR864_15000 [Runella rosea]|uniref:Uncharacterized protein n=1 Tax=Runella rosea TaxID=2259595 RepID=A0A344TJZ1_9BACT|nr:hypothetical protein [Runella rosea]AXE18962.1 hypothetical protein DR864_15000 [Runella rosea]